VWPAFNPSGLFEAEGAGRSNKRTSATGQGCTSNSLAREKMWGHGSMLEEPSYQLAVLTPKEIWKGQGEVVIGSGCYKED
jgi:hypothetical protein